MPSIRDAAEELASRSSMRQGLEQKLSGISIEKDGVVKENLVSRKIEKKKPDRIAGVDGGLVKKRYSAGDVIGVRAVAAVFSFGNDLKVDYLPSGSPEPDFIVCDPGDEESLRNRAESERLKREVSAALDALDHSKTLMDGSIVPSYLNDGETLESYSEMFSEASTGDLVGVVEDSYGRRLSRLVEERSGINVPEVRDTVLMDAMLESGERSFVRKYSESPVEHPVLKELEDRHANKIHTFYVKLSDRDLPLRVDYYGEPGEADRIAGILAGLKTSESYTVPSPIVEADRRAKIPEKYLKRLEKRFSPDVRRRDRRSF